MADAYVGQLIQYVESNGTPHDAKITALYGSDNPTSRCNVDLTYAQPADSPPRIWSSDANVIPQTTVTNAAHQSNVSAGTAYWAEV